MNILKCITALSVSTRLIAFASTLTLTSAAAMADFEWDKTITLSAQGPGYSPSVLLAKGANQFATYWNDANAVHGITESIYSINKWSRPAKLPTGEEDIGGISATLTPSGNTIIAWRGVPLYGTQGIYSLFSLKSGWSEIEKITEKSPNRRCLSIPKILSYKSNGAIILWADCTDFDSRANELSLKVAWKDSSAWRKAEYLKFKPWLLVTPGGLDFDMESVAEAIVVNDNLLIVWQEGDWINYKFPWRYRLLSLLDGRWGEVLDFPVQNISGIKLIQEQDSSITAVLGGQDIRTIRFLSGQWARPEKVVDRTEIPTGGSPVSIDAQINTSGDMLIAWSAIDPTYSDNNTPQAITQSVSRVNGIWGTPKTISNEVGNYLKVAVDLKGNAVAAWASTPSTIDNNIRSAFLSDGMWSSPITVASPLHIQQFPVVASDGNGAFMMQWAEINNDPTTGLKAKRGWFTTNVLSHEVQVIKRGNGLIKSDPEGIECGELCKASFEKDRTVKLTTTPDDGYIFAGWSGACSGKGTCIVSINGDKTINASFTPSSDHSLRTSYNRNGSITSQPGGINCGGISRICESTFSTVTLTATPNPGYYLKKWIGCPAPTGNTCNLTLTQKTTVGAVFAKLPKYPLKITKTPYGEISSDPTGMKCMAKARSCSARFVSGTRVQLTPAPQPGYRFVGWSGACSGATVCEVTMEGKQTVGAQFE